jgi:hypothetical protein
MHLFAMPAPSFDCETKHRTDDPEYPVNRTMRIRFVAQLVSKFFDGFDGDSIEFLFSDHGQNLFVQASSKIEGVRRSTIRLASEPVLGNVAEGWHFRRLDVIAARSLLNGIDLESPDRSAELSFLLPPPPTFLAKRTRSTRFFCAHRRNHFSFPSSQSLPSRDRHVDKARFEFDRIAAPQLIGRD